MRENNDAGELHKSFIRECCAELGDDPKYIEIWSQVDCYWVKRPDGRVRVVRRPIAEDRRSEEVKQALIHNFRDPLGLA